MSATPSPHSDNTLHISAICSVALLAARAFQWEIEDGAPFAGIVVVGVSWISAVAAALWSLVYAIRHARAGLSVFLPLTISLGALVLARVVPFTTISIDVNFWMNKAAREYVVEQVRTSALVPNVDHNGHLISLPTGTGLSAGGDEIVVEGSSKHTFVFFFTFRGIMDNYSGFLWVPEGMTPNEFWDVAERGTQVIRYGDNWYFIGHR